MSEGEIKETELPVQVEENQKKSVENQRFGNNPDEINADNEPG